VIFAYPRLLKFKGEDGRKEGRKGKSNAGEIREQIKVKPYKIILLEFSVSIRYKLVE
jgi:hypothetical protein